MKLSLKLISALLAAMFVIVPFASCNNSGNTVDTTTAEEEQQGNTPVVNEDGVELLAEPIVLCDTTKSYYKVVRPDQTTDLVISCMQQVCSVVKDLDNAKLKLNPETDWVKTGTDTSSFTEILIGNTNRPETAEVLNSIDYDEYAIVVKNNKIVVAAHNKDTLTEATNFLCEKLMKVENGEDGKASKVTFIGSYYFKSDKTFFFTQDNPLANYKIVCNTSSANANKAAKALAEKVKRYFGVELTVVDASDPETELEIVVGNTNRSICAELENVDELSFLMAVKGKKMIIGCTNDSTIDMAIEKFCSLYVNGKYSNTMNFEKDFYEIDNSYVFSDSPDMVVGTDIRIMSFNVLCELWAEEAKDYLPRVQTAAAVIDYYEPHVVGLQEISDKYHTSLNSLFGTKYKIVDAKTSRNETNFSPLAYNTEKVILKDHGTKIFSKGNNTKLRLGAWAVFEDKATGKEFIVVNTHWDLTGNGEYRTVHSNEMAQLVNELKAKYNAPVITTGDYNTKESEEQYKNYVEKAALHEAKYTAKVVKRKTKTTHTLGTALATGEADSIDHIFGTSDVEFLFYNVLADKLIINASDHCPIYADIKLK